jgi:NTP pyrophosphatase (non-canonical NTP hydrolase)
VNDNFEERPEDALRRIAGECVSWKQMAENQAEVIRELKARSLATLQQRVHDWRKAAYPDTRGIELQALGVAEESGELCHAVLKYKQGIRGYGFDKTHEEVADAIGDIIIYAMGVADTLDISVEEALYKTVEHVINRNITQGSDAGHFTKIPVKGVDYEGHAQARAAAAQPKGVDYAGHVPVDTDHEPSDCGGDPDHVHLPGDLSNLTENEKTIARRAVAQATKNEHIPGRPPRRATDTERNTPTHGTITGRLPKDIIEPPYGCE